MTVHAIRPALIQDMTLHSQACWPDAWAWLKLMHREGSAWVLTADSEPAVLFGSFPLSMDEAEVWMEITGPAGRHVLPLLKLARLTLSRLPYRRLIVPNPTRQGAILARRLGFRQAGFFWIAEREIP